MLDSQKFCRISNSHHDQNIYIFSKFFFIILQQKASKKDIFNKNINMYNHHGEFHEKRQKKRQKITIL
jgi:hypothetical protein